MTGDQQPTDYSRNLAQRLDIDFALQAAGLGVWELDPITNVVNWDDRCRELFGLAYHNQLPYEQAIQYIHPDDANRVNEAVQWVMNPQSGGQYDVTYRTLGADDGKLRWVRFYGKAYFTEGSQVVRFAGVAQEVTQQALALQAIKESKNLFQKLVSQAPMGICVVDATTLVAENVNELFLEVTGKSYEAVMGKYLWEPFAEVASTFDVILQGVIDKGITHYENEVLVELIRYGKPELIYVNYVYDPIRDQGGKTQKVVMWVVDVTAEVQARHQLSESEKRHRVLATDLEKITEELAATNEELAANNEEYAAINEELTATSEEVERANQGLEDANQHLARSNQNLEQFAYIASHDLQEPLRKIQQFGDLLKLRYATSGGEELTYLDRMQSAASRMSLLIKELLAFSRISTGLAITAPVSLGNVVNEALDNLSVILEETKAQVEVDKLPTVQGDATQLGQLFLNLLSNALKFSRRDVSGAPIVPQIAVRYRQLLAKDLPATIKPSWLAKTYHLIEVKDNGIGFDEKYKDRIFQVFQRLHGKNEFAGTGVGLAIVQKVVTNHGGAVTASSKAGKGSTFCVYLPD